MPKQPDDRKQTEQTDYEDNIPLPPLSDDVIKLAARFIVDASERLREERRKAA